MMERICVGKLFAVWELILIAQAARPSADKARIEVWDFSGL